MTTLAIEICACSHAPRMHERDDSSEHGRGVCAQRSCGCTEYRPGSVVVAEVRTADEPAPPRPTWTCGDCGQQFDRAQALGSHRRYVHPQTAGRDTDSPSPEPVPVRAEAEAPAAIPSAAGDLAHVKVGLTMPVSEQELADAALIQPAAVDPAEVDPDDVLVGLVRALEAVVDGEPSALLEQALDIRRYMNDRGWRVIEGGAV